tara:strand:- start:1107 stop:1238 length:132 start_codon:yes stop_codon:yes gene_type:complete
MAAGKVLEAVSGQSLDMFFRMRIFDSLGMDRTASMSGKVRRQI